MTYYATSIVLEVYETCFFCYFETNLYGAIVVLTSLLREAVGFKNRDDAGRQDKHSKAVAFSYWG